MKKAAGYLLNVLYPRHCPGCGEILKDQKALLCPSCRRTMRPLTEDYCMKCGAPVEPEEEYCAECSRRNRLFDAGRSVFLYDDRWKKSLERYKFYGHREYADFYAAMMAGLLKRELPRWRPELIVPVPLTRRQERKRGFNQAWLLAERISRQTGIPASAGLVVKTRNTRSQKKLSGAERRQNLRGAFLAEHRIDGITVLVVDDVYTTGSTIEEMARCLREAGARRVFFVTVCTANARPL